MWDVDPAVVAASASLGTTTFLFWQSQRSLFSPFGWICHGKAPPVFLPGSIFLVVSVIPAVLVPLVLRMSVVSLILCVVTSC